MSSLRDGNSYTKLFKFRHVEYFLVKMMLLFWNLVAVFGYRGSILFLSLI
jgi:hypothetical protein